MSEPLKLEAALKQGKANNFGLIRLILATLVVVAHSPELIDGDRTREPFTVVFHTISLGDFAVDGFFIISGLLITKSFCESRSRANYIAKRLIRIVPGYAAAFFMCVFVLAPLVGATAASYSPSDLLGFLLQLLRLRPPEVAGAFHGQPYPVLNGSMWTISYEMRCYGFAFLAGILGFYSSRLRIAYVAGVIVLAAIVALRFGGTLPNFFPTLTGDLHQTSRLTLMFSAGAVYYLFRDRIALTDRICILSGLLVMLGLTSLLLADIAVALAGSYLLFWTSFSCRTSKLSIIASENDISYGVYLYAYPIQNTIIYFTNINNQFLLDVIAIPLVFGAGYLSWRLIESPCLAVIKSRSTTRTTQGVSTSSAQTERLM